jgi:hypothetical protein
MDERERLMINERRADLGFDAIWAAASKTNVHTQDDTRTAITDVLAYVAHFCDRCGLVPEIMFDEGLRSYYGDFEDGPAATANLDHTLPLVDQVSGRP